MIKKRWIFYSKEYYILTSTWYRNKKIHNLIDGVIEWLNERSCGGRRACECNYSKDKKEYFIFSSDDARCGKKEEGRTVCVVNTSCASTQYGI